MLTANEKILLNAIKTKPPLRRCRGERATMRFIYLTNGLPGEGKERSEQTGEHTHTETQVNVKCTSAHIRQIRWDLHRRPTEGGQAERCSKKWPLDVTVIRVQEHRGDRGRKALFCTTGSG